MSKAKEKVKVPKKFSKEDMSKEAQEALAEMEKQMENKDTPLRVRSNKVPAIPGLREQIKVTYGLVCKGSGPLERDDGAVLAGSEGVYDFKKLPSVGSEEEVLCCEDSSDDLVWKKKSDLSSK